MKCHHNHECCCHTECDLSILEERLFCLEKSISIIQAQQKINSLFSYFFFKNPDFAIIKWQQVSVKSSGKFYQTKCINYRIDVIKFALTSDPTRFYTIDELAGNQQDIAKKLLSNMNLNIDLLVLAYDCQITTYLLATINNIYLDNTLYVIESQPILP